MVEPLTSLTLTHVSYTASDPLSHFSAYLALVPQALVITYTTLLWGTRELEIALMFAGQMGCEALNWLLKRAIKEPRPSQMHGKGYGMPSSHAQFVAFFATYLSLFLLLRHQPKPGTQNTLPYWQRLAVSLLSFFWAAAVSASRIYLNYHKPRQVYVGVAVGAGCAVAWFVVTGLARREGVLDWILESSAARMVRLRDLVVEEDLVQAGWERSEDRRRRRKREVSGVNGSAVGSWKKKA